jgi:iron-sulfur cluster repair protein YtfE (RIC family)
MKRSEFLQTLSRGHHHGLHVALLLRRATTASAAETRRAFLEFWRMEGRQHFRAEEDVLLPAYARHRPVDNPAVARVLTEHVDLRRRAAEVEAGDSPSLPELHELGARLEQHIRHEERVLFPAIEAALPQAELEELALALERAEGSG